jgi:hypothetical protein
MLCWDQAISPELKVENTLWVLGRTAIACLVTLGVELAFAAGKSRNELTGAIVERLSTVAELLSSLADGRPDPGAEQHLTRLSMVGTSRVREFLRRSTYSRSIPASYGVMVQPRRAINSGRSVTSQPTGYAEKGAWFVSR